MAIKSKRLFLCLGIFFVFFIFSFKFVYAENLTTNIPDISLEINGSENPRDLSNSIEMLMLFTVLTLLPSILIMMTSFTRVIVILSFLKNAMGVQQAIPSQVIVGLSLFLTFFIMAPVGSEVYSEALRPYFDNEITQEEAFETAMVPVREFMMKQTREKDIKLFMDLSKNEELANSEDLVLENIPNTVIIPAFIISELKTGFQVGFLLFIPFIVIDMVVASTLMSMGMMMLPPMMISLPFKILLFVLVDGWDMVIKSIIVGFN
ncbi:component of the flagellar export machinery [Acetoanaerobium sticklandii]|uniref:Flagellar biosynthetic protein FliP n=1 Tax=Acetoanaerobium sticklandii (strain ATCC 12662 / DSM 519 / JCM 1433 / CCUG 9281 / NCIMB 10654 / HF) TaxID=499177 RepID=E3PSI9_ACESD|nr:flagellar type III secretion system pore protein FliP [Acetoanaerobium sticklandii]CBH21843.1 component of the flagellar export machinery [Acetoanaerobium sticklandii]